MSKSKTLRFRRRRKEPPVGAVDDFSRRYYQLEDERHAAASGEVDSLIKKTPTGLLHELVEHPILRTFGAIEYLGKLVSDLLASAPLTAKALAELEISLIENLPPHAYHPVTISQLRCYAWRDLGLATRVLGSLRESLDALAEAERQVYGYGALLHDVAVVRMAVALTLQEMERFEEARKLLAECKQVFIEYNDEKRLVLATFSEGVLLQRMKLFRQARETYLLLLNSNAPIDTSVRAAIYRAIGFASMELGDLTDAEHNLIRAIDLDRQLSQPVEVIRGQYAFGRLLIRRGEAERAITYLRPVRRQFLDYALTEEAGLCGLEIVEGMLLLGRYSSAEVLARKIISEFTRAGLNTRAITALGYLQEALAESRASTALVKTVREYIVSLRTSPKRDFLPLHITASEPEKSPEQ